MRRTIAALGVALVGACAAPSQTRREAPETPPRGEDPAGGPTDAGAGREVRDAGGPDAARSPSLPDVPDLPAEEHLRSGRDAVREKSTALAAAHLRACVEKAPDDVACWWELGWAHYLRSEWPEVVSAWERVKALKPDHEEVDARLEEARGQVELQKKLEAMAKEAPARVRAPPPPGVSLRLRAVGDVMLGTDFPEGHLPPEDGAQMLAGVKDWLQDADLTFVNLEGPLCDDPRPSDKCRRSKNCYAFRTPTRFVRHLVEAGVDLASTANNHSGDFGETCRRETEAALDAAGIAWSGAPGSIASVEAKGVRVAMVAFHTSPATNDVNDLETARKLVQLAATSHDVVLVSFHGGAEGAKALHVPEGPETFYGENRGDLRRFVRTVVDAGADVVIGHGPHVLRAMEIYKERLVAYSLGNFATYGRFNLSGNLGIGAVLEVVVDGEGRFVSGRILPTRQIGEGVPEKDPSGKAWDLVRFLSHEDFPQTGVTIDAEGGIGPARESTARGAR